MPQEATNAATTSPAGATHLPPRTDSGNAELLAGACKDRLRYDHKRQRWLLWKVHWWAEDTDGEVYRLAKQAARLRYRLTLNFPEDQRLEEAKWAVKSEARYRLDAALALAKSEPLLADSGEAWDADPWLLGVANGVVDLRSGQLRDGCPSDRITKHLSVSYDPEAAAPRWKQFLEEVFDGDMELIDFVQRAVGYTVTGLTGEQVIFLLVGWGANGKTTFLEILLYVFSDYACNMPFATLELSARNPIPNDVAALEGRRLVTSSETNESVRLNEARVKALTGSDRVTARFLYREFFTFVPVAKIWVAVNHKPQVTDASHGFWRRVRVIPFQRQFSEGSEDKRLLEKLKAGAPGILTWAVQGCLKWQREGLGMPASVKAETEAYREEMDVVGEFMNERCVVHPKARVLASALWDEFNEWCKERGERMDRRVFARRLESRGFAKTRVGHDRTWIWQGICRTIDTQSLGISPAADVRSDADVKSEVFSHALPI